MPQMAPMNWIILFTLFSLMFIMFNFINFFIFNKNITNKFMEIKSKNKNWKW